MIDLANLLTDKPIKGNYFAPSAYVQGDMELGLIENRSGARLLALPETLIQGLFAGLEEEIGPAANIVLFSCGNWWGKNLYRRLSEELSAYYDQPLAKMEMIEFIQCLKECWKTHGWGTLDFDLQYYPQGFLVIKIVNSPFIEAAPTGKRPMGHLERGILSAFFSKLTGTELDCVQTSCESLGSEVNHFVLGLAERLKPIDAWVEESHDHQTIMELLANK
jgi:predicted hydrocarbon binding protein